MTYRKEAGRRAIEPPNAAEGDNYTIRLLAAMQAAEEAAWRSLAKSFFSVFGHYADLWKRLNEIGGFERPNPWAKLIAMAERHSRGDADRHGCDEV